MPSWTCSKCGEVIEAGFDVCWECGTAADGTEDPWFQTADATGPIYDPVEDAEFHGIDDLSDELAESLPDLVPCFGADSVTEAQFVANELRSRSIPAVADRHDVNIVLGGFTCDPARVRVRPQDLDRALAWVQTYEQRRRQRRDTES